MKAGIAANRLRSAEIMAILAEYKRAYFAEGVEQPMVVRATLEAELAQLRLDTLRLVDQDNARKMQIRQLRGAILKEHLVALGHPDLVEHCNRLAEAQVSAL